MRKAIIRYYRYLAGLSLLALGSCYTSAQLQDFTRTELARLTADLVGQFLALLVQATSPTAVQ